jgi:hypothetical protein
MEVSKLLVKNKSLKVEYLSAISNRWQKSEGMGKDSGSRILAVGQSVFAPHRIGRFHCTRHISQEEFILLQRKKQRRRACFHPTSLK